MGRMMTSEEKAISVQRIPSAVVAVVGEVLGNHYYHHTTLNTLFREHGAPGDPPPRSCVDKCIAWLEAANEDPNTDAFKVLGGVLQEFMDADIERNGLDPEKWKKGRDRVVRILGEHSLSYSTGGKILGVEAGPPSRSLKEILQERDFIAVNREFERALQFVESDPPAAVTAACAITEALCKVYIEEEKLEMPSKQTVKPLWTVVQKDLGLDPGSVVDQDLQRILSGLSSIVDGVGAFRTHAGSAHGFGSGAYPVESRQARLAIHAAHSLVTFVLESWGKKAK